MPVSSTHTNEIQAARAFSKQSAVFDELYQQDKIILYKRDRVRRHVMEHLYPGGRILELNSGTGEDAVFFAEQGYSLHATDISAGMMEKLNAKAKAAAMDHRISHEICSFTQLGQLKDKGPYDLVFSNFGGLNCTGELDKVLLSLDRLVKPGGKLCLVVISSFCLWELLLLFTGRFKTATRRFFAGKGRSAKVEGESFACWYYSSSFIKKQLKNFRVLAEEGLCTLVPPSYIENFAEKHPRLFHYLAAKETKLAGRWPWRKMGDYFIITMEKEIRNDQ